jgi:uncharacterized membrane protein YfhO
MKPAQIYDILESGQFQDEIEMKLKDLNMYELMGIDHDVHIKRNDKFGFDLEIINDEEKIAYEHKGLHPIAVESLASFCRGFLHSYSHVLDGDLL